MYIYIYICIFAGPLAQGVIEGSCSSTLFVTPFIPQGALGPRSRPAWALPGFRRGSRETWFLHTVLANINIFEFGADNKK